MRWKVTVTYVMSEIGSSWTTTFQGRASDVSTAIQTCVRALGLIGLLIAAPFAFLRQQNPMRVAATAAGIWALLLTVFFEGVWPNL